MNSLVAVKPKISYEVIRAICAAGDRSRLFAASPAAIHGPVRAITEQAMGLWRISGGSWISKIIGIAKQRLFSYQTRPCR